MLEENLRELQVSSADALATEQRRSKDLIARLEREKVKGILSYVFNIFNDCCGRINNN